MNTIKQQFISAFTEELARLSGSDFEYLCVPVFEIIVKDEVLHKGHNLYKKPVGYTADMFTVTGNIAGQCATSADYFYNFAKGVEDVKGAFGNHAQIKKVILFSNQRASGGRFTLLNDELKIKFPNSDVDIYDAERIGQVTFENINLTKKIEAILHHLPKASQYYKLLPEVNILPSFKTDYFPRDEENEILKKLENINYLQIYGISGIGKTEFTLSLAKHLENEFETKIWLNGDDFDNGSINFSAVHLRKFNNNINLGIFLENHKLLLIVDNLNASVLDFIEEFKRFNKSNSKCLISSLSKSLPNANSHELLFINTESAKRILKSATPPPDEKQIDSILKTVKGYPLILILLKSAVEIHDFTWGEIIKELHNIKNLEDDTGKKVSNRIIGKFLDTISEEMGWLKELNKRQTSRHFLADVMGLIGEKALLKRSLIHIQDSFFFNIHQLILDSIIELVNIEPFKLKYSVKVNEYLKTNNETRSIEYYAFIFNHEGYLKGTYDQLPYDDELKKRLLYADIQAKDYFSNPQGIISDLDKFSLKPGQNYYDLLLYIEKSEIILSTLERNSAEHEGFCKEVIANLESWEMTASDAESKKVLKHHLGKFYFKNKNYRKAETIFTEILAVDQTADYAILQLARVYKNLNKLEDAKIEISKILGSEIDLAKQSLSILLSFYELIADKEFADLRSKFIDDKTPFFVTVVLQSINPRFDHPYIVLEKLSSHLSYLNQAALSEICEVLPFPHNIENSKRLMKAYANINLAYFKLLKFNDLPKKGEKMKLAYATAEKYFLRAGLNDDFEKKGLLDLYIMAEEGDKALTYLDTFKAKKNVFYYQNECKAFRILNRLENALQSIENALQCTDTIKDYQRAALLHDKAVTMKALGDANCLYTLEEAIKLQATKKTIEDWKNKKLIWESELTE